MKLGVPYGMFGMDISTMSAKAGGVHEQSALYQQARTIMAAVRLIELGARAVLIQHLTGLEKAKVNRLYCQVTGRPSTSGQAPFSDTWYLKDRYRQLHTSIVWGLFKKLSQEGRDKAHVVIDVYEGYLTIVSQPLLSLARAFFVLQLVEMGLWEECCCQHCQTNYLAPVDSRECVCPGCELYYRYRCRQCGTSLEVSAKGRYLKVCPDCRVVNKLR